MNRPRTKPVAFELVPFARTHRDAVADLHRIALPKGFLSTLGNGFLGTLYGAIAKAPRSFVTVAISGENDVLGFVSGSCDINACYKHVLKTTALGLAWHTAPSLVSPRTWRRIFETLTYPLRNSNGNTDESTGKNVTADLKAELLSIAVSEGAHGMGIGRSLVDHLDRQFMNNGHGERYRVVTDALDDRSNGFYTGVGFRFEQQFEHHGHPMHLYTRHPSIDADGSSP